MSETSSQDIFGPPTIYQIVRPFNRLQGRHPEIPKRQAALERSRFEQCLMGWLGNTVEQSSTPVAEPLLSSGGCRSRLPQVLVALQKWPRAPKVEGRRRFRAPIHRESRQINECDPIFRLLQSLVHRALDCNVGRRA
jgi:hypothetical protein